MSDVVTPDLPLRVDPVDEGLHEPTPGDPLWSESYYLDAISDDGTVGVYARIGDTRNAEVSLMSFVIVRSGLPAITLSDAQAPRVVHDGARMVVDAADYRATFEVTEPVVSQRVTFEGVAVAHRDPGAVLRAESGTPTRVAADLTWRTDGLDYQWKITSRYEIPCRVTGTITIDGEEFTFAGDGQRDHSWGTRDWWGMCWMWSAFRLADADGGQTQVHAVNMRDTEWTFGYVQRDGDLAELGQGAANQVYDGNGRVSEATLRLAGVDLDFAVEPIAYGSLRLVSAEGVVAHFVRAMATFTARDGRIGRGWVEWEFVADPEAPDGFR